jgi:CheY-like chemotaxis protein
VSRVLVVDHDPMVCTAMEIRLRRQGFEVTDAGDAVIRALERPAFDRIRVDMLMPHRRSPTIPLIAVSDHALADIDATSPDFVQTPLELGATTCPSKPNALLPAISECL